MAWALKKYGSGKLTWAQLIEPARRLAAEGFPLSYGLARAMKADADELGRYPESKKVYLNNGNFWNEGDVWRQPELAATFARLQRNGAREFYEGQTARLIADDMRAHGGLITLEDMKRSEERRVGKECRSRWS